MRKSKIIFILLLAISVFTLTGCGIKSSKDISINGSLDDIMTKLYDGIDKDEMPVMMDNIRLTDENFKKYAFIDTDYSEAIVSEPKIGSIAHSVVLIRLNDGVDADKVVQDIKDNVDPRKWICVEAENVYVLRKGNLVVLIMSNELANPIKENFENLK